MGEGGLQGSAVLEVPVEGGPGTAGSLGDVAHRDRGRTVLAEQAARCREDLFDGGV